MLFRSRNDGGQTGLHWAAYGAHVDVVKALVERYAPVDVKDKHFNATPLDVALYVWSNSTDQEERERCYDVIVLLARAGATLDPKHWQNEHGAGILEKIQSDPRMLAALGGGITQ